MNNVNESEHFVNLKQSLTEILNATDTELYQAFKSLPFTDISNLYQKLSIIKEAWKVGIGNVDTTEEQKEVTTEPNEVYKTPEELSEEFKMTTKTIWYNLRAGKMKGTKIGHKWIIPMSQFKK